MIITEWLMFFSVVGDVTNGTGELDLCRPFSLRLIVRSATWEGQHASTDEERTSQTGDKYWCCKLRKEEIRELLHLFQ